MADVRGCDFFAIKIDEVEPLLRRMDAEIGNAHNVAPPDCIARPVKLALGDIEQHAVADRSGTRLRSEPCGQGGHCQRGSGEDPGGKAGFEKIATLHNCNTIYPIMAFP